MTPATRIERPATDTPTGQAQTAVNGLLALQHAVGNRATTQALSAHLQRQKDSLANQREAYYDRVAMTIVDLAERENIPLAQAMILIAQAQEEQGIRDPAKHRYRIFNAQATWAEEKALKAVPQTGLHTERISSPEWVPDPKHPGQKKLEPRISPFFVYDSLDDSINHLFRRLAEKYQAALKILHDPSGTTAKYAAALQRAGWATAPDYAPKMVQQHRTVVKEFTGFLHGKLDLERRNLATGQAALADQWDRVRSQWDVLSDLKRQRADQADDPAAASDLDQRIAAAERDLAEMESTLREIEQYLKDREDQLRKLEPLVEQADAIAASLGF